VGKRDCAYLRSSTLSELEYIAHYIHNKFPDRPDRQTWIGDACPQSGNCSGHPNGSHAGGQRLDINYFVIDDHNSTQYGISKEYPYIEVCDGEKVTSKFDWERNYYFIKKLVEITGNDTSRTCDAIQNYIFQKLYKQFGRTVGNEWYQMISGDIGTKWQHHRHYHLNMN